MCLHIYMTNVASLANLFASFRNKTNFIRMKQFNLITFKTVKKELLAKDTSVYLVNDEFLTEARCSSSRIKQFSYENVFQNFL